MGFFGGQGFNRLGDELRGVGVALEIPVPIISLTVTEDHSGGAFTIPRALTIPIPTVIGTAALSWLLVDDCEDAWNEYVAANVVSTADGADKQVGSFSAKMDVAIDVAVGRLATKAISPLDLTGYAYLKAKVKSSINLDAVDLNIMLDDHAQCVSPLKELDIGALTAGEWTDITLALGDASGLGTVISIGIDMNTDKGAFIFHIDQVRVTEGL